MKIIKLMALLVISTSLCALDKKIAPFSQCNDIYNSFNQMSTPKKIGAVIVGGFLGTLNPLVPVTVAAIGVGKFCHDSLNNYTKKN